MKNTRCAIRSFALLFLLSTSASTLSEPAEDHWEPDSDREVWQAITETRQLIESENYTAALNLLEKLAWDAPDNAEVYNLLGYTYRKQGDFERSLPAYQRALVIDPDHKGALEYQGELYLARISHQIRAPSLDH